MSIAKWQNIAGSKNFFKTPLISKQNWWQNQVYYYQSSLYMALHTYQGDLSSSAARIKNTVAGGR